MTETIPVPWDKPKTQLPAEQDAAVVQAKAVAEAMLDDTADADPMKIKSRVQAAMNLCDERDWQTAKNEFAYASICCEFRWAQDNPRGEHGGDRTPEPEASPTPGLAPNGVSSTTRQRIHDAYEGATADDVRTAKETADAEDTAGQPLHRPAGSRGPV